MKALIQRIILPLNLYRPRDVGWADILRFTGADGVYRLSNNTFELVLMGYNKDN
jgi:hypothetical protein